MPFRRLVHTIRPRWIVLLLGILAGGLIAELAPCAVGVPGAPDRPGLPAVCAGPGTDAAWDATTAPDGLEPGDSTTALEPVRFDCGVGEPWRHHVP